jgi:ABC-type nickel/cobalt efflux system permease component RcnA
MNLGLMFYIFVVGLIIAVGAIYFMKHKKRLPYTHEKKQNQKLTQLDKMLTNIKYEVPVAKTEKVPVFEKKEITDEKHPIEHKTGTAHAEHEENQQETKKQNKEKKDQQIDLKSAIIYSSIIQRKKTEH